LGKTGRVGDNQKQAQTKVRDAGLRLTPEV